jgi:hypothetical protein
MKNHKNASNQNLFLKLIDQDSQTNRYSIILLLLKIIFNEIVIGVKDGVEDLKDGSIVACILLMVEVMIGSSSTEGK